MSPRRCAWARTPLSIAYHDAEWGVPVHDDRVHFEFLILEGAQAGLSWETILNKRDAYRKAFSGFDPARVARFTAARIDRLLTDPGIVRNRLKIQSAVTNANAFLEVQRQFGSFDAYVWQFIGGKPRVNRPNGLTPIPATTAESDALSRDLSRRGFKFVGSTIMYAFMQAVGMVNDHTVDCFKAVGRRAEARRSVRHSPRTERPALAGRQVTKSQTPAAQLDAFLRKFTPGVAAEARSALARTRRLVPGAVELVYDNYNALVIGFCASERASDGVLSLAVFPRWVTLCFIQNGPDLPDPDGLLKGSGNMVRHVRLSSAADLDKPAIRALINAALRLASPRIDPKGRRRLVIRSISAKQRPRRPL